MRTAFAVLTVVPPNESTPTQATYIVKVLKIRERSKAKISLIVS